MYIYIYILSIHEVEVQLGAIYFEGSRPQEPPMIFKIICNGDTTPLGLAAILGPSLGTWVGRTRRYPR